MKMEETEAACISVVSRTCGGRDLSVELATWMKREQFQSSIRWSVDRGSCSLDAWLLRDFSGEAKSRWSSFGVVGSSQEDMEQQSVGRVASWEFRCCSWRNTEIAVVQDEGRASIEC
ncbi:hypothetical protein ACJRO7_016324 [Eucalyptus globulus]|uniref:Uncharacterized protein n=1 Tax=Eucalyptus globulus TaxID=34317 RepID=A0ABD3L6R5_EUCGL